MFMTHIYIHTIESVHRDDYNLDKFCQVIKLEEKVELDTDVPNILNSPSINLTTIGHCSGG